VASFKRVVQVHFILQTHPFERIPFFTNVSTHRGVEHEKRCHHTITFKRSTAVV